VKEITITWLATFLGAASISGAGYLLVSAI